MKIDDTSELCKNNESHAAKAYRRNITSFRVVFFYLTFFRLYSLNSKNWIALYEVFFLSLNGIHNFMEFKMKRIKIGESTAVVILFCPDMQLNFSRSLCVFFSKDYILMH